MPNSGSLISFFLFVCFVQHWCISFCFIIFILLFKNVTLDESSEAWHIDIFLKIYFYFMHVSVLPECIYVRSQCLQRPEESIGIFGTRVIKVRSCQENAENGTQVLCKSSKYS